MSDSERTSDQQGEGWTKNPLPAVAGSTAHAARDALVRDAAELVVEAFFDVGPNCRAFESCIADLRAALET
jgi:hypothetical protein